MRVALDASHRFGQAFGRPRLVATFLLGSLARGGFSPAASDVDVGLVIAGTAPEDERLVDAVSNAVRNGGYPLCSRLSVFWSSSECLREGSSAGGRFPAVDRIDLLDHGILLRGLDERSTYRRPIWQDALQDSARLALERLSPAATQLSSPGAMADNPLLLSKLTLMPVRLLCGAATRNLAPTENAVRWYIANPDAVARPLVAAAYQWRMKPTQSNLKHFASLVFPGIAELHRDFIERFDIYLHVDGIYAFSSDFADWRQLLE